LTDALVDAAGDEDLALWEIKDIMDEMKRRVDSRKGKST
jgi:hypothetical protein